MQRNRLIKLIQALLLGACVLMLLSIPWVVEHAPRLAMNYRVGKASSADPRTREVGLDYIVRYASKDAKIRDAAIDLLDQTQDEENFLQIMKALDFAGLWDRQTVPHEPFLRWVTLTAGRTDARSRLLAVSFLGDMHDKADDVRVQALLARLADDTDADVRYNAMVGAAGLAVESKSASTAYMKIIEGRVHDPSVGIARQAWMMLGLTAQATRLPQGLTKMDDRVAQAAAWALMASDAPGAEEAMQMAVIDPRVPMPMRTGLVYSLRMGKLVTSGITLERAVRMLERPLGPDGKPIESSVAGKAELAPDLSGSADGAAADVPPELRPVPIPMDDKSAWFFRRAVLAIPDDEQSRPALADATLYALSMQKPGVTLGVEPWEFLFAASFYRRSPLSPPQVLKELSDPNVVRGLLSNATLGLAILEGLPEGSAQVPLVEMMSDYHRLAALRASPAPDVEGLYTLLASEDPAVRDQAAVIAWKHLKTQQQAALIDRLLKDYNDQAKMSGGFLAGLTGQGATLLEKRVRDEDKWEVQQVLRLGQVMMRAGNGQKPTDKELESLRSLLMRDDLPRTTIVLGLLFMNDGVCLEFLFNPRGEPYLPLVDLLGTRRWWMALREFAPLGLPGFQLWADPELLRFQVDLMRNWYLIHKRVVAFPKR